MSVNPECLQAALYAFPYDDIITDAVPYGGGHINDTFAVSVKKGKEEKIAYILQRINTNVFKEPQKVMDNIFAVTEYLQTELQKHNEDTTSGVLHFIRTKNGEKMFIDQEEHPWRSYHFVPHSFTYNQTPSAQVFGEAGFAFGTFLKHLQHYPAATLHETIPSFHDTRKRMQALQEAITANKAGRAAGCSEEIEFALARTQDCGILMDALEAGMLPLRVTHNDTKLNNILFDETTQNALCVIDLDTIMPGLALNDYGDSIRFGASTASEDETDLSKVNFSMPYFKEFTYNYLKATAGVLTQAEVAMLAHGARLLTFECGIRFLTDYLNGDAYFKVLRNNHNLDRCRTQFKLVDDMEKQFALMQQTVRNLYKGIYW